MNKCLITKLNGSVTNDELLKIGEIRIHVKSCPSPSDKTQGIAISSIKETTLTIVGDGYFTDNTLSENKGKIYNLPAHTLTDIFVSNGDFDISISDKYSLDILSLKSSVSDSLPDYHYFDIENLCYSKEIMELNFSGNSVSGNIDTLASLTRVTKIHIEDSPIFGNVSFLKDMVNLKEVKLYGMRFVGNFSSFSQCAKLKAAFLTGTNINGDISVFGSLLNLDTLHLSYGTGDISSLKNLSQLKQIVCSGKLSGDLSQLPASTFSVFCNSSSSFSWTNRPNTSYILGIAGCPHIDDLDNMLQNEAECKAIDTSVESNKTIDISGTRTSASDAAVTTLQQKGYTVSITPA